jgi:putative spermidine/putrescine transport system permease protein
VRNLGASLRQTLWLVLLPNIKPAIVSSAIFAFIHSWDETVIVLFISGRALFTLPRRMWDGINDNLDPSMAAVATLLIVFSVMMLCLDLLLKRRKT